jgi:hypothetical protein
VQLRRAEALRGGYPVLCSVAEAARYPSHDRFISGSATAKPTNSSPRMNDALAVGFALAGEIAERRDPVLINDREHGTGVWTSLAHRPDLVALAPFTDIDRETWSIAGRGI